MLSVFRKKASCLFSSFGWRGAGVDVGRRDKRTLKMFGGDAGLVDPPGILIICVSKSQCFSQIKKRRCINGEIFSNWESVQPCLLLQLIFFNRKKSTFNGPVILSRAVHNTKFTRHFVRLIGVYIFILKKPL